MPGTLFVVATPIGNLEDITLRAIRTLKTVDLVAAEDTRRTAKLLAHYDIRRPMMSLRAHTEAREAPRLVARLRAGDSIALVSDAGTPGISDPGSRLVRAVHDAGLPVIPIPGPSAVAAAVSVSGFPADSFTFLGFPPASGRARDEWFAAAKFDPKTLVLFEAPHRIARTLAELKSILVDRPIICTKEISKIHENYVVRRNHNSSVDVHQKGEFTVVIGPADRVHEARIEVQRAIDVFGYLTNTAKVSDDLACTAIAACYGSRPEAVRKTIKRAMILAKQQNDMS
jgi:16S rRNA (cytidine1402-2'-O)-methyltransferase